MRYLAALAILTAAAALLPANATAQDTFPWDGSRTTPVHRLPLFNEFGEQIVPTYEHSLPFSSINTCGTCHTYNVVNDGWHFNASKDNVPAGRPGEPWVLVDEKTGTQIPLSYRDWDGFWHPYEIGMSDWDFTKAFGRHLAGGDVAYPEDISDDPASRWQVSGKIEINCLGCHSASHEQDMSEWSKQIERENFRWAATAASGLAEVNGMAERMPEAWSVYDGPNPDDQEYAVAPSTEYYQQKFDNKFRTVFDITWQAQDDNCMYCHSVSPAGSERWHTEMDVHTRAGMRCVDCHRNGLDHMIIRGYEGEKLPTPIEGNEEYASVDVQNTSLSETQRELIKQMGSVVETATPKASEFSCRGCHMGESRDGEFTATGGRMGAPFPEHKGIPPIHFETMSCTVCHVGEMPGEDLQRVRTSRVNRLGIHGRAQWFTAYPAIYQPVYVRNSKGVIEPRRLMWPAFWARMDSDKATPLRPEDISATSEGILNAEEQVANVLLALVSHPDVPGTPLYILSDKIFEATSDRRLVPYDKPTSPSLLPGVSWAVVDEETLRPLIPPLEFVDGMLDWDMEQGIINIFDALDRFHPIENATFAVETEGRRLTLNEGGYLDVEEIDSSQKATRFITIQNEEINSLIPDFVRNSIEQRSTNPGVFTEEQISLVLQKLETNTDEKHAYISGGKAYTRNNDGTLTAADHSAAAPVTWPMGHEVKPAVLSLGARSCAECHSSEAPFFFAEVKATGPLITKEVIALPMYEFADEDPDYHRLFGDSFRYRTAYKQVLLGTGILLLAILLIFGLLLLRGLIRYLGPRG